MVRIVIVVSSEGDNSDGDTDQFDIADCGI